MIHGINGNAAFVVQHGEHQGWRRDAAVDATDEVSALVAVEDRLRKLDGVDLPPRRIGFDVRGDQRGVAFQVFVADIE